MSHHRQTLWIDLVVLVVWMAFIWLHSLMDADSSLKESGFVVELLSPLFRALGIDDTHEQTHIVRKTAHFLEYLVLGILACRASRPHRAFSVVAIAIIVLAVPSIDEAIQLMVPGRAGTVFDVLLDISGACTGILIFVFVHQILKRKNTPIYQAKHLA